MEEFNEFSRLLYRHNLDLLSSEEHHELDKRIENKDEMYVFDIVTDKDEHSKAADFFTTLDPAKKLSAIQSKLQFAVTDKASSINIGFLTRSIHWRKSFPAAAVTTGLLLLTVYFAIIYFSTKLNSADQIVYKQEEILPGGNKGTLTLADGTVIVLEHTKDGRIPVDGKGSITKQNGSLTYIPGNKGNGFHTLATPRGGTYAMTLPDGSRVWLNASSSLKYPASMAGGLRKVILTGEAYFEVSPFRGPGGSTATPFIIEISGRNMQIEVHGTDFNINAYSEEEAIKTSLFNGKMKIIANGKTAMLESAQEAQFYGNALTIVDLDATGITATKAWKEGQFDFQSADLKSIIFQIGRWYDIDVEFNDKAFPVRNFRAELSRDRNLSDVLRVLELNEIHFKLEGRKLMLQGK